MLYLLHHYLSISLGQRMKDRAEGTAVGEKRLILPVCTPVEHNRYACRVMSTFQLSSRPLTQGHVRTVALGTLRKLNSYTVTVLKELYCDPNALPPLFGMLYWSARGKLDFSKPPQPFRRAG